MSEYDVAVVGGGAAGLSAALVLARARRRVVVIDAGEPRNAPAAHVHGFLSRDGLPPGELLAMGRAEVEVYGGHLIDGLVVDVRVLGPGRFELRLADDRTIEARRVLVATGLRDVLPDLPGVRERWGKDLLHCPYCHGYEVRDEPLGVLGGTADSVAHALLVRQWSDDVVFFAHTGELTAYEREQLAARSIQIVEGPVRRLVVEDDRLTGVELEDGTVVRRSAVFSRPDLVPNDGLTSVPGVWVAGNVANPRAQVITAAAEGSAAAIALNADLVDEDVRIALDQPTHPHLESS